METYYKMFNGSNTDRINKFLQVPNIAILMTPFLKEELQKFFRGGEDTGIKIEG